MFEPFLNPWLLGGAAFIGVPIVLHLIMRQQPKKIEFPALRFIRQREHANRRKLRFRHWLLLALRCLAILFLATALARPRVVTSSGFAGQEVPVAAAFVFDTSPRMLYKSQNQTRLEAAREVALSLIPQLPGESDIAVLDTGFSAAAFSVDRGAARNKIERLDTIAVGRNLQATVTEALRLVKEHEKPRKELYVFTDLTHGAWTPENAASLTSRLAAEPDIALYVIDVGVPQPRNLSIGDIRLSKDQLSLKTPWRLDVEVRSVGMAEDRGVKLYLPDKTGKPEVRSQQSVRFQPDSAQTLTFTLAGLTDPGVYQGQIRLDGEDALVVDDSRFFSVEARAPWRILLSAPPPTEIGVSAMRRALTGPFDCDVCPLDDLAKKNLSDYAAIVLLDPKPLSPLTWQQLTAYVKQGGGLAMAAGRNAVPREQFQQNAALELLPARLLRQVNAQNWNLHIVPAGVEHPVLRVFKSWNAESVWQSFPIFRYWELDEPFPGTSVILLYSDGRPALLERVVDGERGHVLFLTTPVSEPASEKQPWNILATGENAWPFFVLANEMLFHLVGTERLNYQAGEVARLSVPVEQHAGNWVLGTPRGDQITQTPDAKLRAVTISTTDSPGSYTLSSGGSQGVRRGFSVNLAANATNVNRLTEKEVNQIFGEKRYHLAHNQAEIVRDLSTGRVGVELFPWLALILAFVLAAEHLLGSLFYRQSVKPDAKARKRIVPEETAAATVNSEQ